MPGEPEARREEERTRTGIPLSTEVLASLEAEAADLKVAMPHSFLVPIVECTLGNACDD